MYDMTVYALHQLTSVLGTGAERRRRCPGCEFPSARSLAKEITTEADDNTVLLLDFGDAVAAVATALPRAQSPSSSAPGCSSARAARSRESC